MSATSDRMASRADLDVEPIEAERSLGELMARLGDDLGQLVTTQVDLARRELSEEVRQAGQTAALFGAGAFVGYLALLLLCFAGAWGLAEVLPEGVAFLIVGVVVGVVAALMVMAGRKRLEQTKQVAPQTVRSLKEDVEWTKEQVG